MKSTMPYRKPGVSKNVTGKHYNDNMEKNAGGEKNENVAMRGRQTAKSRREHWKSGTPPT